MNSDDVCRVLLSEGEINDIVTSLAEKINRDYLGKEIILVGLLKGSVVFMADLMRKITVPCSVDFIAASSYGNSTVSSGCVKISKDLSLDIKDRHVLVVEDIIDSGITLSSLMSILRERKPASIKLCAFVSKPSRRVKNVNIDYLGAEIPDEFVVGYGLDYAEKYRNLPYLCVLKPEVYI